MQRVVILGRGAAGKSTLARQLGEFTGLPVVELAKLFWRPGLTATQRDEWTTLQEQCALRRARERTDFWRWVLAYRRDSVPHLSAMIARHAPSANVHVIRGPSALKQFLNGVAGQYRDPGQSSQDRAGLI